MYIFEVLKGYHKSSPCGGLGGSGWVWGGFSKHGHTQAHNLDPVIMSDKELAQLTFAFRIFDHDVDTSYSTRENHTFRNNMATLGVTTMSAGSKTDPGGYASYPTSLEQFAISDEATPGQVAADLRSLGREPVWKDWDRIFD